MARDSELVWLEVCLVRCATDRNDKQGYTPLHAAAASGHIEIVKYLLRMGAEIILTCFLLSVFPVGHVEVVKLLVSRSADKSCKDKQGYTPLHAAAAMSRFL
uniref:Uncharacterized protein n=1 Tax=Monopterus albus TaxID=43700 RepID=A0A3Q3JPU4_MONAL